jgi:uncharacterized membrane protein
MRSRLRHFSVIAVGYILGAALFSRLPEQIPPSWTNSEQDTIWLGGPMVAFLLPTAALITFVLLRTLGARHPSEINDSTEFLITYDAIMFRLVLFLTGVHATVLVGLLGLLWGREWAARIVPVLLGALLIGTGNLLPRTRPNLAIGIRTSRTLSDRGLWMRTHRIGGYLVVALGLVILLAGIAVPAPVGPRMGRLVEPAALFGIPALVLYSRRKARN